jgi:glycosyltransferase involved in cell wall biosynthesis
MKAEDFPILYLVVGTFLKPGTTERILGGTETYTDALVQLARRAGGKAVVFQRSKTSFETDIPDYSRVIGWSSVEELRGQLRKYRSKAHGVLIQYDGMFIPDEDELPCVIVQHGIGGDGTADPKDRPFWLQKLADWRRFWRVARGPHTSLPILKSVNHVVCVDTNFINHMRSAMPMYDWTDRLFYLPNFANLHPPEAVTNKWAGARTGALNVLFARRFEFHRGTWLWVECVRDLAREFPESQFRFCGHGPGEQAVRNLMTSSPNVTCYSRPFEAMQRELAEVHISVVPSLWSEGTSLSCIEAMAAGCAPVVSNVGGLGNLVVPGYNGELLPPTVDEFRRAVRNLLTNPALAEAYGRRSYDMASQSFSRTVWENRFQTLLQRLQDKPGLQSLQRRFKPR